MVGISVPSRLERLISIEQQINQQRYPNVDKLCRMFNVKPRTVFDDIRLLKRSMGLNIRFDRLRNGYYNANPGSKLPPFELSNDEFYALVMAAESLIDSGKIVPGVVESMLAKIIDRLPSHIGEQVSDFRTRVRLDLHLMDKVKTDRS
jgi:predicted DNA-binding transcriptional regulator YafY